MKFLTLVLDQFKIDKRTFTRYSLSLNGLDTYDEEIKWLYPFRSLPNLKYQVFVGPYSGYSDVQYNLGSSLKLNDEVQMPRLQEYLAASIFTEEYKSFSTRFKKYLKSKGINSKKTPSDELANYLYYYYQRQQLVNGYKYGLNQRSDDYQFIKRFHEALGRHIYRS